MKFIFYLILVLLLVPLQTTLLPHLSVWNIKPDLGLVAAALVGLFAGELEGLLVGLAIGLGARYPRFNADATQVAGSYGGVAFMIVAVLLIIAMIVLVGWPSTTYLFYQLRHRPIPAVRLVLMGSCFAAATVLTVVTWLQGLRSGVRALDAMSN